MHPRQGGLAPSLFGRTGPPYQRAAKATVEATKKYRTRIAKVHQPVAQA